MGNIEALRLVFALDKERRKATVSERKLLQSYCGFGGLKCVLNPASSLMDVVSWSKSEAELFGLTLKLHNLLKDNSASETEYKGYLNSLKNSVLTAFYTPPAVVSAIADSLKESGITPNRVLDPSAGQGAFVSAFAEDKTDVVAFEKDLLTSKLLKHIYPEHKVQGAGFETIEQSYNNYFDVVSSNIPFGDLKVFDPALDDSPERKLAKNAIHNYFFVKSLDAAREGGVVAFITSQGVLNAPTSEPVRRYLMEHSNLVSAVRLPNNLFTDHAGTEVGSDLIILQKRSCEHSLTEEQKEFIESINTGGISQNNYIKNHDAVVATSRSLGSDQYGRVAIEYTHSGGVDGIASDLRERLRADFAKRLDLGLYNGQEVKKQDKEFVPDLFNTAPIQDQERAYYLENPRDIYDTIDWESNPPISGFYETMMNTPYERRAELLVEVDKSKDERFQQYTKIRDNYNELYRFEANNRIENSEMRAQLNEAYNTFVEKYGNLNSRANAKVILMDSAGRDVLSLERAEDGVFIKADIFNRPVAFSQNEITSVDTPLEALSASLNKYGGVNLEYMAKLTGNDESAIIEELKGRIYFNPIVDNYEIADRFIAGNVVDKAEQIEAYLGNNPDDRRATESLQALYDATPRPIPFEELDFNFGERWIPTGIYATYASHLFDTKIDIAYSESMDEYSVKCAAKNAKIYDQFAVKGYYRTYDGISLLKHALVNTVPDISKSAGQDESGRDIKVRDSEAIQLANAKIDEIRNGFTDWLGEQSEQFQNRLTEMYNSKFNCFVRPQYDGSHQTFPDIDLKALEKRFGIKDIYASQKDAIWMIKQRSFSKVGQNGVTYCKCG
ncbi:MAG: N-6 DNA methylase [Rikenellaceae bacterium]